MTADGTPPSAKVGILWPTASSTSENIDRTEGSLALQFSDSLSWFPRHHLADLPEVAQTSQEKGMNCPQSEGTIRLQVPVAVLVAVS
jgi:hypothetical protein